MNMKWRRRGDDAGSRGWPKFWAVTVLVVVLTLAAAVAVACGEDETTTTAAAPQTTAATAPPTTAAPTTAPTQATETTQASTADTLPGWPAYVSTEFEKKEPLKLGMASYYSVWAYFQRIEAGFKAACEDYGAEAIIADCKADFQGQQQALMDLMNQGVSGIAISAVDVSALPPMIDGAHEEGIPFVLNEQGAAGNYDCVIFQENEAGIQLAVDHLVELYHSKGMTGKKEIAFCGSVPGQEVVQIRQNAFYDAIAKYPDEFELVAEVWSGAVVEDAYKAAQDVLSAHPNCVLIYCNDDNSAIGCVQGIKAAGKVPGPDGDVQVVGFNGDPAALDLIINGELTATVADDPFLQGYTAVEVILNLLDGKPVEFEQPERRAPRAIFSPTILITRDNAADWLEKVAKELEDYKG